MLFQNSNSITEYLQVKKKNFSYIIDVTFIGDNRYLESVVEAWPFRDTGLLNVLLQNICDFFFYTQERLSVLMHKNDSWLCDLTNQRYLFKKHFGYLSWWRGSFLFQCNQCNTVCLSLSALWVESGYMKTFGQLFSNITNVSDSQTLGRCHKIYLFFQVNELD